MKIKKTINLFTFISSLAVEEGVGADSGTSVFKEIQILQSISNNFKITEKRRTLMNSSRFIGPKVMLKLSSLFFNANLYSKNLIRDKIFVDFVYESFQVKREFRPLISLLIIIYSSGSLSIPI
jgi:hypothetical protein